VNSYPGAVSYIRKLRNLIPSHYFPYREDWQMNICQLPVADEHPQPVLEMLALDKYPVPATVKIQPQSIV
jgi:hypothetical protein